MQATIHELIQGSDEWCAFRLNHNGASEAAAMLGLSPKVSRTQLLHAKHTGLPKEFAAWVQENILDHGHAVEALARPLVEEHIEDDLYPVTCSLGAESASCDGLTMSERVAWEHKQWNEALASAVAACELPDEYMPQCQQVLMVTGADKLLFTVSNGTLDRMRHMWVLPDKEWFERIRAGWAQFAQDLADYEPRQLADKPQAEAIIALPALVANIRGEVTLTNLPQFKERADAFIAAIKTDLQNDQDFADAELTIKFCDAAEKDIDRAKAAAIAQTASIDDLMRTVDLVKEQLRGKRLMLTKLVDKRKVEIKESILADAKLAYAEHVTNLEAEIKPLRLSQAAPDFAGAMKNKRTLASLHDAVDTLLASAKISTNATAADYRTKQTWCREAAAGFGFLFMDMAQIIVKPMEDFQLLVTSRIDEHKRAEAKKEEEARARIAAEERAKAEAAAAETIRLAKIESDRVAEEAAAAERVKVAAETKRQLDAQAASIAAARAAEQLTTAPVQQQTPAAVEDDPDFLEVATAAPAQPHGLVYIAQPPSLRLGQINERIAPLSISADGLRQLGFEPAARDKAAQMYHERDFQSICAALVRHLGAVQTKLAA